MKGLELYRSPWRQSGVSDCHLPVKIPRHNGERSSESQMERGHHARLQRLRLTRFCGGPQKLNRDGLRWYGIRTVEPHHDGTVHWHMMVFAHPEEIDSIVVSPAILPFRKTATSWAMILLRALRRSMSTAQKAHQPAISRPTSGKTRTAGPWMASTRKQANHALTTKPENQW